MSLGFALGGVVFDGVAGPFDVPVVQQVRAEEARFDERDLDAEPLDLGRDRQRKALDRELRCGVGGAVLEPDHTRQRADVDDVARPLLPHDRQHGAHHVHHAIEVRRELAFEFGDGHLFEIAEQAVAGVVDRDVDPAEPLDRFLDGRFRLCLVGNVQLDKREVLARNVAEGVAHFVEIPAGRHNAVTGSQGGLGDPGADATPAPVMNHTLLMNRFLPFQRATNIQRF